MAVTLDPLTDGDFVEMDDADSSSAWDATGSMTMEALVTGAPVEGTGAIETRIQTGVGFLLISRASQNLEDTHIRGWLKLAQGLDTVANGGARLRIGDLNDYGEWNVYGSERQVLVYNGWMALCVDILRPFDDAGGTPPDITAILDSGFRINWLNGNGKALDTADRLWFGNVLFIEGGSTGDRGTFSEIAVADESSGHGLIRPLGGVFFANSECAFGEEGTATSFFEDGNEVLIFEDLPVSGALYKIRHAANSTGTNHVQFGESDGSGVDKEGTSGITFKAAGAAPFRVEAIDANIDVAAYFGCSLSGPPALYDDALRNVKVEDNSGASFTDITRDANYPYSAGASITSSSIANPTNILCSAPHGFRSGASVSITGHTGSTPSINGTHTITLVDTTNFTIPVNVSIGGTGGSVVSLQAPDVMPATEAINDAFYVGHDERFYEFNIKLLTAKGGTWTGVWEYFNGSTWELLTDLTDGTANFATIGLQVVTFSIPDDWAANAIDTDTRYWIRFRIDSFTSSGTTPVLEQVSVAMAGDIRLEDAAVEMIGCTLTNMGSVRVRNGAFLKKTLITDSIVPAKHAAVDLGGADPSADTVRDLTIQNCINGILLKGTGDDTFNFRNIQFAGNTNDVRVDYGPSDTVTINILEGGDTPTINNVNGSTVVINNAVVVKVTALDAGAPVEGARVLVLAEDTGDLPDHDVVTITQTGGTASVSHTGHGMLDGQLIVIEDANEQGYNLTAVPITNVTTNAYDYTVDSGLSSPATGTITSTAVILSGLTNASGIVEDTGFNFTNPQGLNGELRKGTSSPTFKTAPITGNIVAVTGFNLTLTLVPDD